MSDTSTVERTSEPLAYTEASARTAGARSLKVELVLIGKLIPYAKNARTHSDEQIKVIASSIEHFGWTNPILCGKDGDVIAGHGRILGAKLLGMTKVPVIRITDMTDDERRAYIIADNQTALRAGWDPEILRLELGELAANGFDLAPIGFDPVELASLLGPQEGLTDPDDVPEVPENPVTGPHDLWLLGAHRLLCGDSTKADDVQRLLAGANPHLMVTDPPYGVEYEASWRNDAAAKGLIGQKKSTRAIGKVTNDHRADWREAYALFPGDVAYVWHAGNKAHIVAESLIVVGFAIRAQIIWAKNNMVISRGHYHPQHEPLYYAVKDKGTGHWSGDRTQTTLWQIEKNMKSETGHSTQKPVECMKRPIENNSSPGQAVYDPFVGSGTTIIAAEMTGRCCYAIEVDPAYVDLGIIRWQNFSGEKAVLDGDGRTFDEIAAKRIAA
jgi:DNA modification methylase